MEKKKVIIDPRGDDVKCLDEITAYIPLEREDLLSYISYIKFEFIDQLNIDRKPHDISLWSDEDVEEFLNTGKNPYKEE